MTLLAVRDLCLEAGGRTLVEGVSFDVAPGETLGLVGESGSGKTLSALSVLDLLPPGITRRGGRIVLDDCDIATATEARKQQLRGGVAGMIFQEPMSSLNPLQRVGAQVAEALLLHGKFTRRSLRARVIALLREAGLGDAAQRVDDYPHLLSGGQRQRVMIAMALANDPKLLIADEPTTALDVTLEKQILDLIARAQKARGLGVLLITHDLDLVRRHASRVLVLDRGRMVEAGATERIFTAPASPQTRRLLAARDSPPAPPPAPGPVVLEAAHLTVRFPLRRGALRRKVGEIAAVDDVSFTLREGETLGLVGESGSGKSTIALLLPRLIRFQGRVSFQGQDLARLDKRALRRLRAKLQIVFQDPYGSLSPRLAVGDIVGEGLALHAPELRPNARRARVEEALAQVGLPGDTLGRYPHEFSGGQRQRIAIARALVLQPRVLILDEPTSALDVTVQAEILDLLRDLQARLRLAYLFISHDLRVIRALAHRIIVLRAGQVVESGEASHILTGASAPYTRALLAAAGLREAHIPAGTPDIAGDPGGV